MPQEIWGYQIGQNVEYLGWDGIPYDGIHRGARIWIPAVVVGFTPSRTVLVRANDGTYEIDTPMDLRPCKKPGTPNEIEAYLNG